MSYDLMLKKAIDLQNDGALNEAESLYLKILEAAPQNSDVWNLLGLIAQSRGDFKQALNSFLTAIQYAPTPFAPHFFNLGLTYKALEKPVEALDAFSRAVSLMPDFKEAWNLLAIMQEQAGNHTAAVKSFCKALEIDPDYTEALANLCFYTNDKTALLKLADENVGSFNANFLAARCDKERAEHYLKRALEAAPFRTDALIALGQELAFQTRYDEALIFFHKALNLDNNEIWAVLGAADAYLAKGELEKAESYYKKSFDIRRDIAGAHLNYGIILYQQKRLAEALEEYRAAAVLAPDKPEISYNLALILKETGDIEEALGLMFNAHLKDRDNETYAINLMETLMALFGQNAELALKIAENWQKTAPDNIFSKRLLAAFCQQQDGGDDAQYAKKLFDSFANTYDATLSRLNSQIIPAFLTHHGAVKGRILDLGCGTGLAAAALKNDNASFDGVDISEKMIEKARQRGVYDSLFTMDIISFLQKNPPKGHYELVISFDVFCYLADLTPVFEQLKGCELWFSIEAADESLGKNYYLSAGGRYKHQRQFIEKALQRVGFKEIKAFELALREENGQPVKGFLFKAK